MSFLKSICKYSYTHNNYWQLLVQKWYFVDMVYVKSNIWYTRVFCYVLYLMRMSVYIVVWESSVDENDTVCHKPQSRVWTHNNDQSEPICHVTAILWAYCISRRIISRREFTIFSGLPNYRGNNNPCPHHKKQKQKQHQQRNPGTFHSWQKKSNHVPWKMYESNWTCMNMTKVVVDVIVW